MRNRYTQNRKMVELMGVEEVLGLNLDDIQKGVQKVADTAQKIKTAVQPVVSIFTPTKTAAPVTTPAPATVIPQAVAGIPMSMLLLMAAGLVGTYFITRRR